MTRRSSAAIGAAFSTSATLLDVHSDADHHRSVFTLVGEDEPLVDSLLAGIATTVELVDLREHLGVHPRVGAADVVPLVPLAPEEHGARGRGGALARRDGSETSSGCPSSSTARLASAGGRRSSGAAASTCSGGGSRRGSSSRMPGLLELDPRSGAVLVGARHALVAYNLDLATDDVEVAEAVARGGARVERRDAGCSGDRTLRSRAPGASR